MIKPNGIESGPQSAGALLRRLCDSPSQDDWARFLTVYGPTIYRYGRRHGLQDADALDVVQNVCMRVCRAIPTLQYDARRGTLEGWLYTIAVREINRCRKRTSIASRVWPRTTGLARSITSKRRSMRRGQPRMFASLPNCAGALRMQTKPENWQAFELVHMRGIKPVAVARLVGKHVKWIYRVKYKITCRLKSELIALADAEVRREWTTSRHNTRCRN